MKEQNEQIENHDVEPEQEGLAYDPGTLNHILSVRKALLGRINGLMGGKLSSDEIREVTEKPLEELMDPLKFWQNVYGSAIKNVTSSKRAMFEKNILPLLVELRALNIETGDLTEVLEDEQQYKFSKDYDMKFSSSVFENARLLYRMDNPEQTYLRGEIADSKALIEELRGDKNPSSKTKKSLQHEEEILLQLKYDLAHIKTAALPLDDVASVSKDAKREYEHRVDSNYFDWLTGHLLVLNRLRRGYRETDEKLVLTPSLRKYIESAERRLQEGPALLKGDTGSGKTEIAIYVSRKQDKENLEQIKRNYFELYHKHVSDEEALAPIIISGSKETDRTDFFGGLEIAPMEINIAKFKEEYMKMKAEIEEAGGLSAEEKRLLTNSALETGTAQNIKTQAYLGRLFTAMKLGKTLIIDETNAIPHAVLIAINHYITRKPGDDVQPPVNGYRPFPVAKGFRVILTANLPKEGQEGYVGRQFVDAAFRNRLGAEIEVDYPENTRKDNFALPDHLELQVKQGLMEPDEAYAKFIGELSNEQRKIIRNGGKLVLKNGEEPIECESRETNELFHILSIMGDSSEKFTGALPENYFSQLFKLSKGARVLQDAFSGKKVDNRYYGNMAGSTENVLKTAVPSMRTLLDIVHSWRNDGFKKDLDYYIWVNFIQKYSEKKNEQLFIYNVFNDMGFFGDKDLFPANPSELNIKGLILREEFIPDSTARMKTFSQEDVLTRLFGPPPVLNIAEKNVLLGVKKPEKFDLEAAKVKLEQEIMEIRYEIERFVEGFEREILANYCKI